MPMEQAPKDRPLTKSQFHQRLREWADSTSANGDKIVGPEGVDGRMRWAYVQGPEGLFALHADTRRDAVERYLGLVAKHGDGLLWTVRQSRRGRMTAVAYGPGNPPHEVTPFYLYFVKAPPLA
jgi:hypothetical protein